MEKLTKVTLLCTSDVHGYYMPWDYSSDRRSKIGGLTRVSTIYKELKEENPNTILIDNGDLIQGNNAEYFIKDSQFPGINVINEIGYEILNMGNHEFNFGMENLIHVVSQFKGISMMGNLYRKKNTMRFMNGVYYKNIGNIRIGFVSLNTPLVRKFEAKRGNLKNFDVIDADFELEKLLNEVGECDAIIAIFHMGDFNENNIPNTGAIDLLNNVPGANRIDAIFAGHMHEVVNKKINNTIFLEPGVHAEAISRLDLYFDEKKEKKLVDIKGSIIEVNNETESDPDIEKELEYFHKTLRQHINELAGYTIEDLSEDDDIRGIPQIRVAQTKIVGFFIDVMKHYSKADVLAIHFDNPYPFIKNGPIKRKDINFAYSYSGGEISNYEITGEQLKKYMEWSAEYFNKSNIGDINISFNKERRKFKYSTYDIFGNIKYDVDITEDIGNRIKNLRYLDDKPILPEDTIIIGMNKYRMDYLTSTIGVLSAEKIKSTYSTIKDKSLGVRGTIRNLAFKYLKELPDNLYIPRKEKNWKIIRNNKYKEYIDLSIKLINKGLLDLYKKENGVNDLSKSLNIFDNLTEQQLVKLKKFYKIEADSNVLKDILDEIKDRI